MDTLIDVSVWQGTIDWPRVRAAGVTFAYIRGPIGDRWVDDNFHANWQGALGAGIPRRGVYCDVILGQSASAQAVNILHQTNGDFGTEPVALDVERTDAERKAIAAGTLVWPKAAYTEMLHQLVLALQAIHPVAIYTSKNEWEAMTTQPEWAKDLIHWIAQYNSHISNPDVPAGWDWDMWQYGQGHVDGITNPVDLNQERVPMQPLYPSHVQGSLNGIHLQQPGIAEDMMKRAKAGGYYIPWLLAVENPGMCVVAKKYDKRTVTGCRWMYPDGNWEYGQNIQTCSDAELLDYVHKALRWAIDRTNDDEWNAIDYIQACHNEWDPPTEAGWRRFGQFCLLMIQESAKLNDELARRGRHPYHLAFGAFNCGTPEWNEMLAFASTGVFEAAKAGGHILLIHEGAFEHQPVDWGFDGTPGPDGAPNHYTIPGAPYVPGSGNRSGRIKYWYVIMEQRDAVIPFVVGETYLGGEYNMPVEEQMSRLAWQDKLYRSMGLRCLGWGLFTIGPYSNWGGADYTYVQGSHEYDLYMQGQYPIPNGGEMNNSTKVNLMALAALAAATRAANDTAAKKLDDAIAALPDNAGAVPLYRATVLYDCLLRDKDTNLITHPTLAPDGVVKTGTQVDVYAEVDLPNGYVHRAVLTLDADKPNICYTTTAKGPALKKL